LQCTAVELSILFCRHAVKESSKAHVVVLPYSFMVQSRHEQKLAITSIALPCCERLQVTLGLLN
jgi:hypothetical protein